MSLISKDTFALEESRVRLATLATKASQWGVWCKEDRGGQGAWCDGTIGTYEHAAQQLPRWQSGVGANVDPTRFTYTVAHMFTDADVLREVTEGVRLHVPRVLERLAELEKLVDAAEYRFNGDGGLFAVLLSPGGNLGWSVMRVTSEAEGEYLDNVAVDLRLEDAIAKARRLAGATP